MKRLWKVVLVLILLVSCEPINLSGASSESSLPAKPPGSYDDEEWILIPANTGNYGLPAFYVMKYEARAYNDNSDIYDMDGNSVDLSTHKPKSVAQNIPWRSISAIEAFDECEDRGPGFALISNAEWMAIARSIEIIDENWTNGSVGSGCLFKGNNSDATCGYNGATVEDRTIANPRAIFKVASSEIADLTGNLWEWTDWDKDTTGFQISYATCGGGYVEYFSCGGLSNDEWEPAMPGVHGRDEGTGYVYAAGSRAVARGGGQSQSGLYTISFTSDASATRGSHIGFRCVYRP